MYVLWLNVTIIFQTIYGSVTFPAVTFCNLSPLRYSQLSLGGKDLQDAIVELEDNIYREMTGSPTLEENRKRRKRNANIEADTNEPHPDRETSSFLSRINLPQVDSQTEIGPWYGFGSSAKGCHHGRERRGFVESSSSVKLSASQSGRFV